jgi:hypothetical protein
LAQRRPRLSLLLAVAILIVVLVAYASAAGVAAPIGLSAAIPQAQNPSSLLQVPPRPTGIAEPSIGSPESNDYTPIDPMAWYESPQDLVGRRISLTVYVHGVQKAVDDDGQYTVVIGYPAVTKGVYASPWLIYFGETVSVTPGLWLDVYGTGSTWITSTDGLGHESIVPMIAAVNYITYTEPPYSRCQACEVK